MAVATLSKWGTGQGIHVSKKTMAEAQVKVGDTCDVIVGPGIITLDFTGETHRAVRRESVTFEDVFGSWKGSRDQASDPWDGEATHGAEEELWG